MILLISSKEKKIFALTIISILYFFSTDIGSNLIIYPLEKDWLNQYFFYYSLLTKPENVIKLYKDVDKIVVLDGGIRETKELKGETLARTITAYLVYKNLKKFYNKSPEIIILGGNIKKEIPTSTYMKKFLENISENIPIIDEKESLDTFQNINNLKKIFLSKRIDIRKTKILVITSAFHIPRTKLSLENTFGKKIIESNIIFLPCSFRYTYKHDIYDFLPSTESIEKINIALSEFIGILYYTVYYKVYYKVNQSK